MVIKNFLKFLVNSNVYLAIGAGINAIVVAFLLNMPILLEIFFIPFSGSFFIYNLNRISDIKEDTLNLPERVNFIKKYGKKIFFISFIFYLIALILSFLKNIIVGIVVLIPVIIAIFYSFFRLKKITFIKNILVGFAWAFGNCVLVYSFFNIWNLQSIIFFLIFFLSFTINTIIFDIKDITGDRIQNIITMPVKYGIKNTKLILYGIFILTILITFYSFLLNFNTIIIFPYIIFLGVCINYIRENKKYPWWYFGVAVDGEFLILFLSFIVYTLMVL